MTKLEHILTITSLIGLLLFEIFVFTLPIWALVLFILVVVGFFVRGWGFPLIRLLVTMFKDHHGLL
jgi:hypothetical protein